MAECLNYHPSTAAEARAFTDNLPGGTAAFAMPPRPQSTMPPPPLPQLQPQSPQVAVPTVGDLIGNGSTADTKSTAMEVEDESNKMDIDTPAFQGLAGSGVIPTIQNIVASVNVDCRLDLKTIALHCRNAEYNPKRFSAVIMRIRDPKSTALIFASGKMVVTGNKSEDDARLAARKFTRIILKLGFAAKFLDYKLHNVVASCDVRFPISLQRLASFHPTFSQYEPGMYHTIQ